MMEGAGKIHETEAAGGIAFNDLQQAIGGSGLTGNVAAAEITFPESGSMPAAVISAEVEDASGSAVSDSHEGVDDSLETSGPMVSARAALLKTFKDVSAAEGQNAAIDEEYVPRRDAAAAAREAAMQKLVGDILLAPDNAWDTPDSKIGSTVAAKLTDYLYEKTQSVYTASPEANEELKRIAQALRKVRGDSDQSALIPHLVTTSKGRLEQQGADFDPNKEINMFMQVGGLQYREATQLVHWEIDREGISRRSHER